MKTITIETPISVRMDQAAIPVAPRGRALYTIDWFMNGTPTRSNHDDQPMTLQQVSPR